MKILTLNTWQEEGPWRERWEVIFQGIASAQPDIVGFQEVFNADWAEEVRRLTGYPEKIFSADHAGQMILSKFPVPKWEGYRFKEESPTEDYVRYILYAQVKVGEQRLNVFNTHLSWKLDESDVRVRQAGELIEYIDKKAGVEEALLMGDLNAPPKTPEMKRMVVEGKFNDIYRACHPKEEGLTWDNRNPFAAGHSEKYPDRRLDYVFTRNNAKLLGKLTSCDLMFTKPDAKGIYASDHYGVMATFG